jgi:hypothetical protein
MRPRVMVTAPRLALYDLIVELVPTAKPKVSGESRDITIVLTNYEAIDLAKALDRLMVTRVAREET